MNKCSICGKKIEGYGNNPWPMSGESCCDKCDNEVVLPLRLFLSGTRKDQILVVYPNKTLILIDEDTDDVSLRELQSFVDGYIEVYPKESEHFFYIVNEEGLLKNMEFNVAAKELLDIEAVGPVVVVPKNLFK